MQAVTASVVIAVALVGCIDGAPVEPDDAVFAAMAGPTGTHPVTLIERASRWDYLDHEPTETATWSSGAAPFGRGEPYVTTEVDAGTAYFRRVVDVPLGVRALLLRVMYDDGFVVYLNGHDAGRGSMPSGPVTPRTLAFEHEADRRFVEYDITAQLPRLVAGEANTIAFEIHQATAGSPDLVFDAELIAWVEGAVDDTSHGRIPAGSTWHYWDRPDVPAGWIAPAFDDARWSSGPGPLGRGEAFVTTPTNPGTITTYFRKRFTHHGEARGLHADVRYDDGFVAYLNGKEIARAGMAGGTITPSTRARVHEAGEPERLDWSAAIPLLVDGLNVLAVEVHQAAMSSADLVLDLALTPE
jgi:hypothetical protein